MGIKDQEPEINFKSLNFPEKALRHKDFECFLEDFEGEGPPEDWKFKIKKGLADENKISFESVNFPNHFIRHQGFRVKVNEDDGSDLFAKDATFHSGGVIAEMLSKINRRQLTVNLKGFNFPEHGLRHKNYEFFLEEFKVDGPPEDFEFIMRPGLTDPAKVSFESVNFPDYYIRHQGFRVKLHNLKETDDEDLFKNDATFELIKPNAEDADWGADKSLCSFRSVNFPDHFLRHKNFELWLDERDDSELFNKDTTFKFLAMPECVNFVSMNFPTHCMRHRDFEAFNDPLDDYNDDYDFFIRPGLDDAKGVSFEAKNFPNHFLRHQGFRLKLHEYEDDDLYRKDSTFILDTAPKRPREYFSLRSVNFPDKFLRHKNFEMWLEDQGEGPIEDFCWKMKKDA